MLNNIEMSEIAIWSQINFFKKIINYCRLNSSLLHDLVIKELYYVKREILKERRKYVGLMRKSALDFKEVCKK